MPGIVCAIRGGPESRRTIKKAITLSQESGQEIHFLYVINLDYLSGSLHTHVQVMTQELQKMGEFILLAAQETADKNKVTAHGITRKGSVAEEIIALCEEVDADYVILGRPQQTQQDNVLEEGRLDEFAQKIEEASKAKVVFVEGNAE